MYRKPSCSHASGVVPRGSRSVPATLLLLAVLAGAAWGSSPVALAPADSARTEAERAELVLNTPGFSGEVTGLAFSPDGTLLAAAGEKEVRIWNVSTGDLVATLRADRDQTSYGNCYAVAFSPDGRYLAVGYDSYGAEGSIRVYAVGQWDRIEGLLRGQGAPQVQGPLPGQGVPTRHLAFSPDGAYLASAGNNGKVLFWQWRDRRLVGSFAPPWGEQGVFYYFGFPTSKPLLLLRGPGGESLVSVPEGTLADRQNGVPDYLSHWLASFPESRFPYQGSPARMALRLDQAMWAASGAGSELGRSRYWVGAWHTESRAPRQVYLGHSYVVSAVALNHKGTLAASADVLGEVHLWETRTGAARHVFRGLGQPIYRAAFGPSGYDPGFTTTPHPAAQFDRNRFGTIDRVWQFDKRRMMASGPSASYRTELTQEGPRRLQVEFADGLYSLVTFKQDAVESRYPIRAGAMPMCYTFLRSSGLGKESLVVVGDDAGNLLAYDPATKIERRFFSGHRSMVTSLGESADGRFLISSSADRTIRIWSLQNYRPTGDIDFRCLADRVIEVEPGGAAAAAGIRVGDRFVSLDGHNPTEIDRMMLRGDFPYLPGQQVTLAMERDGQPYQAAVVLREGGDVVQPLLSLFLADDNTWVLWTPQGYYDASPGGDQLIGWDLNQGPANSAKFYPVHQFRRELYRPDVIDLVLQAGDVGEALRRADAAAARPTKPYDLRRPEQLERIEPPRVRILEPADGARTTAPRITVRAEISSPNQLPVNDVKVLVNGRPGRKGVAVELEGAAAEPAQSPIVREVTLTPGENTISVLASNGVSTSAPQSVRVTFQAGGTPRNQGNLYLLVMGISHYKNPKYNLQFARRDAEAFLETWRRQEGAFYRKVEVRVLLDDQATAANLRDAMDWLLRSVTQHDVAMLFFSGHGVPDTRNNYYLATYETDPARLRSTAVPSSDVNRLIQDMPCKVLVFADTCHSGGITGAKALGEDPWQDLGAAETGAVVFASSTPREASLERDEWQHGAFTKAFLDTMGDPKSDTNGNGYLEITELDDHLSNRVKELTAGQQHPVTAKPPTIRNIALARAAVQGITAR